MRKIFIAGNWKMFFTADKARAYASELKEALADINDVDLAVCTNPIALEGVAKILAGSNIGVGSKNCSENNEGAFTGEVTTEMVKAVGATYALVGHSERRTIFGETDAIVNAKTKKILAEGLLPILCIGETLEEREGGITEKVIKTQLTAALDGISAEDMEKITVAYEPVWAIGTGKVATPEMAQETHAQARQILANLYSDELAQKVRIQYGGSVKPENAKELMNQPDIDGALVGGAALKADSFKGIATYNS